MENYGRINYEQYTRTGIRPGTFYYENTTVKLARQKIGQLIIGVSPKNSTAPMTIMMLNPRWFNWRGIPLENNFYICEIWDRPYLCFHANGVIFIIDDQYHDVKSIKPMCDIGELMQSAVYA